MVFNFKTQISSELTLKLYVELLQVVSLISSIMNWLKYQCCIDYKNVYCYFEYSCFKLVIPQSDWSINYFIVIRMLKHLCDKVCLYKSHRPNESVSMNPQGVPMQTQLVRMTGGVCLTMWLAWGYGCTLTDAYEIVMDALVQCANVQGGGAGLPQIAKHLHPHPSPVRSYECSFYLWFGYIWPLFY